MNQRTRATRNRFIIWLVLIAAAALLADFGFVVWQVAWMVFALFTFYEVFAQLHYIERAIRGDTDEGSAAEAGDTDEA